MLDKSQAESAADALTRPHVIRREEAARQRALWWAVEARNAPIRFGCIGAVGGGYLGAHFGNLLGAVIGAVANFLIFAGACYLWRRLLPAPATQPGVPADGPRTAREDRR